MKIVWDENKRKANVEKHGLDFADVVLFDWAGAKIYRAKPDPDGRQRLKAVGYFEQQVTVVIFSLMGTEATSVISFRSASAKERASLHDS